MTLDVESVSLQPRGSFAQLISIEKMGNGVVNGWTIYNTSTDFCTTFYVFMLYKRLTIG